MPPRISLITPSFQQAKYLEECLRSVHDQDYPMLEHIVVDGGSSDGSKEIIARSADRLAWWCSEADGGQAAAINKGLAHATGDVFGWLNSDDALLPGALTRVGEAFAADPELLVHSGRRIILREDGSRETAPLDDPSDREALFLRPRINQQSTFYRLEAVRAIGGVEDRLRYAMDYELWLQLLFRHGTEHLLFDPVDLALFRVHGRSKTASGQDGFANEMAGVLHGLCKACGADDLARVLATGYMWPHGLRAIPTAPDRAPLVRRMVTRFLLRWNHVIFDERRFRMMRLFRDSVRPDPASLGSEERTWLAEVMQQLNVPGWWAFRLRRKWRHLAP